MIQLNRNKITKTLSIGIMLMGLVHIAATFTPVIAGKLALLPNSAQNAFTYFSLMCGALLVLGGGVTYTLSGKTAEYAFTRKPYVLALSILNADGVLAVCCMPHNPCAWIIFALAIGLTLASVTRAQNR